MDNDVKYINEFVVKYNEFKNEISKIIVGFENKKQLNNRHNF